MYVDFHRRPRELFEDKTKELDSNNTIEQNNNIYIIIIEDGELHVPTLVDIKYHPL
jgi:hypothetical protein